ncbi:hypothetical protein OG439_40630 [Amycolatopsis sp. NBC_01307]|uniref:hypothetical protein n=1 Tax=Amycolatopsis sp. NBC_01307 TaxID=2903561 RepID=UPI002E10E5DD|nr:hypothetical protein OG439_40630 [Amycolatopsis sp. NBC_01307]
MCRSTSDGGRRCTGSSHARTRALGTARKAVERAGRAVDQARAAGDQAAVDAAKARLTAAEQRLDDTRATHPHTPAAGQPRGHDTAEETEMPEDTSPRHDDGADASAHRPDETPVHDGDTTPGVIDLAPGESYRVDDNVIHNGGSAPTQVYHSGDGDTHFTESFAPARSDHADRADRTADATASEQQSPELKAQLKSLAQARRNLEDFAQGNAKAQPEHHYYGDGPVFLHGGTGDTFFNGERVGPSSSDEAHGADRDGPQTTSHTTTSDGTTFTNVNNAAPGAVVGIQAHTVNGATVVMGGGPIPAGLPDQLRQVHEQVQTAMASGHYTVHHSDDITEPSGPTAPGERVAFQVGYVHRRDNPTT